MVMQFIGPQELEELLAAKLKALREPQVVRGSSTAAPITVTLDLTGVKSRPLVEVRLRSSGDTTFLLHESDDGVAWQGVDEVRYLPVGPWLRRAYLTSAAYFRVMSSDSFNHEVEIRASG
jgi:hypothetical protein